MISQINSAPSTSIVDPINLRIQEPYIFASKAVEILARMKKDPSDSKVQTLLSEMSQKVPLPQYLDQPFSVFKKGIIDQDTVSKDVQDAYQRILHEAPGFSAVLMAYSDAKNVIADLKNPGIPNNIRDHDKAHLSDDLSNINRAVLYSSIQLPENSLQNLTHLMAALNSIDPSTDINELKGRFEETLSLFGIKDPGHLLDLLTQ